MWRNDVAYRHDLADTIGGAVWRPARPELAVLSGQTLSLWPYASGEPLALEVFSDTLDIRKPYLPLAWSPTGDSLAAWDQGGALLMYGANLPEGAITTTLNLPGPVEGAAWSPDGKTLVALLRSGDALALSGNMSLKAARRFSPSTASDASGAFGGVIFVDAGHFLTWGRNTAPKLWAFDDLAAPKATYPLNLGAVSGIDLAPDRSRFAVFGENGDVDLFQRGRNTAVDPAGAQPFGGAGGLERRSAGDRGFGRHGARVGFGRVGHAAAGCGNSRATAPGTTLGQSYVNALEWRPGGRLFGTAEDGSARIWQVLDGDGRPVCSGGWTTGPTKTVCAADSRALRGHQDRLDVLRWSNAQTLLSTDVTGAARRWDLQTGETFLVSGTPGRRAPRAVESRRVDGVRVRCARRAEWSRRRRHHRCAHRCSAATVKGTGAVGPLVGPGLARRP